jgi:transcriptional regulator with XRE-family HTH domain
VISYSDTIPGMEDLADRLIKARTDKGMTQGELASAAGVSQSTIGNLESRLRLTARKLAVIANVLGVNAYWLETGEGSPHGQPRDELLDQVAALTPAARSVVAALVASLRGVSIGALAEEDADYRGLDEYEKRILTLVRQLDARGKDEAESSLAQRVKDIKAIPGHAPEVPADREPKLRITKG